MEVEDVLKVIAGGENEKVEFKRSAKGIGPEICAFANALGGIVLVGVDNSGRIVGCNAKQEAERVGSELQSILPRPKVRTRKVRIGQKEVLVVEVERSQAVTTIGGVAYVRVGTSKRPMSLQEIVALGAEYVSITFDKEPSKAPAREMSKGYWKEFLKRRSAKGLSPVKGLEEKLGVVVKRGRRKVLSIAGLLMFHESPQSYLPYSRVRLILPSGEKRIEGPVWKMVEESVQAVMLEMARIHGFAGAERLEAMPVPVRAVREAVTNALVHRNYGIGSEVFITVSPLSISIRNPGAFPPGSSPEMPMPVPRNPLLYELMFQMGYVEKQGGGIEMIKDLCRRAGVEVEFKIRPYFTLVTMKSKASLDEVDNEILSSLSTMSRASEIAKAIGLSKPAVVSRLKKLEAFGLVKRAGRGRATRWLKNR